MTETTPPGHTPQIFQDTVISTISPQSQRVRSEIVDSVPRLETVTRDGQPIVDLSWLSSDSVTAAPDVSVAQQSTSLEVRPSCSVHPLLMMYMSPRRVLNMWSTLRQPRHQLLRTLRLTLWFGTRSLTGRSQQSFSENTILTYSGSLPSTHLLIPPMSPLLPIVHWPSFSRRLHNSTRSDSPTWTSFVLSLCEPIFCFNTACVNKVDIQSPIALYSCLVRARHLCQRMSSSSSISGVTRRVVNCTVRS